MLTEPAAFFDACRKGLLGPTLSDSEVEGLNALVAALSGLPVGQAAYALGTAYLETSHTMQPIKEFGGPSYFFRMYDKDGARPTVARTLGNTEPGDGARFAGRGYVQMTGRTEYRRASMALGLGTELLDDPDKAMSAEIAAKVMRRGMVEGWFTGKTLADYLPVTGGCGSSSSFVPARRIINGLDRAGDVADYAWQFQGALLAGGWR